MNSLDVLLNLILWIYTHSPPYVVNDYINGLQMTSNPDSYLTPPQIIARNGYPIETHIVPTQDGYLLQLHRIPHGKSDNANRNRYPILLIHGGPDSSAAWIENGPEKSLAYLLADNGFDVWMMNMRGNTFSTAHITFTPKEREFWNFSYHEIGIYDIPASIDYVLNKTNHEQLFCIGYSIGNSVFYIMLSELPQYNDKIVAQISLAPFLTLVHERQVLGFLANILKSALEQLYWNTPGGIAQHDLETKLELRILNSIYIFGYSLNDILINLIYGMPLHHLNKDTAPILLNNWPAGTSVKAALHFHQMLDSFANFDYGSEENLKMYGTSRPSEYNISNIKVPIRVYYAVSDTIAGPEEAIPLYEKLPVKAGIVEITDPMFYHMDYMSNANINQLLNDDVLNVIPYMIFNTSNQASQ
ncbi:lipase 1-like [Planococcus citri]|uniref:lipase 1-like n=1 Tax=Planococcus citri TaxID=170843 RepID=UPI0031F92726